MKSFLVSILLLVSALPSHAALRIPGSRSLDGQKYCRTVIGDGSMGSPRGVTADCLEFSNGSLIDYGNGFFGNPPVMHTYTVVDNVVKIVLPNDGLQALFQIADDKLVSFAPQPQVFYKVIPGARTSLDGSEFCRTYMGDGSFGQPRSERTFCASFANGRMTESSRGGNAPTTIAYTVSSNGKTVWSIDQAGKRRYQYKIEGETLVSKSGAVLTKQ